VDRAAGLLQAREGQREELGRIGQVSHDDAVGLTDRRDIAVVAKAGFDDVGHVVELDVLLQEMVRDGILLDRDDPRRPSVHGQRNREIADAREEIDDRLSLDG
jgi:hypothetical protein